MSSWVSALEQLAALDPTDFDPAALSDEQLREVIPLAQIGLNRLVAMQTRTVGAAEARAAHTGDGIVSMKSWLTGHCRISGRKAATLVRDGRRVRELPALASAYAAGAPPAWCDIHHVDHWAWGGETSCDNGALICERHHTAVHEGGFSIARDAGTSTWHTYRPDGSEIRIGGSSP